MLYINSDKMKPDHELLVGAVNDSIRRGIKLKNLEVLLPFCVKSVEVAADTLRRKWGIGNPNAAADINRFLSSCDMEEVYAACYKDGKWSSKAENLKELAAGGFEPAIDILSYRKAKAYSNAVSGLIGLRRGDGRVYPEISVQKTNRIGYKSPALLNIPRALLWSVIEPRMDDSRIICIDVKQQEPKILMNMLGIEDLQDLARYNSDIYSAAYKELFGTECNTKQRDEFKMCWNATTYGASKKSLVERCKYIDGGAVYSYLHRFKELSDYIGRSYAMSRKGVNKVETYFGTVVETDKVGGALRRSLLDIPIQGTGADILAFMVEHLTRLVDDAGLDTDIELYYTRHDELVLEVSNSLIDGIGGDEAIKEYLRENFKHEIDDWFPIEVDVDFAEENSELLEQAKSFVESGGAEFTEHEFEDDFDEYY